MCTSELRPKARRCVGLVLTASLVWACGDAPPDEPANDPAAPSQQAAGDLEAAPVTYPVVLTPSRRSRERFERDPQTGETRFVATRVDQLMHFAYDIHPADVIYAVPLDHETRYDVRVRPTNAEADTARAMLRERLEEEFAIRALRRPRTVPVLILQQIDGAPDLRESTATERTITGGAGHLRARKASTKNLARFIRTLSAKPVVDESGLEGEYDFVMTWDATQGTPAFFAALRGIGFELVPGERPVEKLIIRRAAGG
ncbi:MAG: TIGR03435 family protein [Myxococcota bacterium]